jgi:hypothetical protein
VAVTALALAAGAGIGHAESGASVDARAGSGLDLRAGGLFSMTNDRGGNHVVAFAPAERSPRQGGLVRDRRHRAPTHPTLVDGATVGPFRVLATPGHTEDHVALLGRSVASSLRATRRRTSPRWDRTPPRMTPSRRARASAAWP